MSAAAAGGSPTLDVVGIGNALVDVLSHEEDALIQELGLPKGGMSLIDADRMQELYERMGPGVEASGGSAANTMAGVASFGGKAHYLGKVADDQLGTVFAHDMRAIGVGYDTAPATSGTPSGCCLVLITPDGHRTMNTFLGASAEFGPEDIDAGTIGSARILYLEGYLFDRPLAQDAYRAASKVAADAGCEVALTLSDSFCVERHRDAFRDLVANHVDLLFANEAEICALYEVDDFDAAVERVRVDCAVAALTRSEHGSVVVTPEKVVAVAAVPVAHLVDTTGAGDQYAAGFMFGRCRGLDLAACGRLGSIAAGEVISHIGARPVARLADLVKGALQV